MKVSVIIPLYNAEKYFGDCLESLLAQTFRDFEVIVVDDCSTDLSLAVAENFWERFGGRLKIISLPRNTGSGAAPRNEGLKFSRGEYVFFMDNDDLLIDNALETLCNFARDYNADVVCMEKGFLCSEKFLPENVVISNWDKISSPIDKPTLETPILSERVEKFLRTEYGWAPWIKFLRRDFLIDNDITFPEIRISEDVAWTFKIICLAKNFLRVPNLLYVCRSVKNSWSRVRRSPQEEIKFWLDPLIKGVDFLDEFMDDLNFFARNPNYRFKVTNFFVKMQLAGMLDALDKLDNHELYEIFRREFSKADSRHAAFIANLIIFMNFYRNRSNRG